MAALRKGSPGPGDASTVKRLALYVFDVMAKLVAFPVAVAFGLAEVLGHVSQWLRRAFAALLVLGIPLGAALLAEMAFPYASIAVIIVVALACLFLLVLQLAASSSSVRFSELGLWFLPVGLALVGSAIGSAIHD